MAALAGPDVRLIDVSAEQLQRALSTIRRNLDRQVTRGTVAAAAVEPALARISHGTDLAAAGDAD